MNNEQQQIIDEAYENYLNNCKHNYVGPDWMRPDIDFQYLTKEEFINKCKTDNEFSEKWGLKIEERELYMEERWRLADLTPNMTEFDYCNKLCDDHNVPTKLITVTYKDKTIESYEQSR